VGFDAFCTIGQRVLGLRTFLEGHDERLLELLCYHLETGKERMTVLPGHRVRRFYIERHGREGRMHLFDGTATAIVFHLDHDDPPVLHWVGLTELEEGERRWFDLTARCPAATPALDIPDLVQSVGLPG
jgi:hypothetical protein